MSINILIVVNISKCQMSNVEEFYQYLRFNYYQYPEIRNLCLIKMTSKYDEADGCKCNFFWIQIKSFHFSVIFTIILATREQIYKYVTRSRHKGLKLEI